jgi:hypothetical protein
MRVHVLWMYPWFYALALTLHTLTTLSPSHLYHHTANLPILSHSPHHSPCGTQRLASTLRPILHRASDPAGLRPPGPARRTCISLSVMAFDDNERLRITSRLLCHHCVKPSAVASLCKRAIIYTGTHICRPRPSSEHDTRRRNVDGSVTGWTLLTCAVLSEPQPLPSPVRFYICRLDVMACRFSGTESSLSRVYNRCIALP